MTERLNWTEDNTEHFKLCMSFHFHCAENMICIELALFKG